MINICLLYVVVIFTSIYNQKEPEIKRSRLSSFTLNSHLFHQSQALYGTTLEFHKCSPSPHDPHSASHCRTASIVLPPSPSTRLKHNIASKPPWTSALSGFCLQLLQWNLQRTIADHYHFSANSCHILMKRKCSTLIYL